MKRFLKIGMISLVALSAAACTRVSTGEVGVRTDFSRNIQTEELLPGSWNQVMFGDVALFPVKDVQADVYDMNPLAADNSTIKDLDVSVIYSIEPGSVADIYIEKSRSFHATDENDGQTYLMYNYIKNITRAATYKVARRYESLKMNDSRAEIETLIREEIVAAMTREKLQNAITISQVQVRAITPADSIVNSANDLVKAQNQQKQKEVEVSTARLEAERQQLLAQNSDQITKYMNAEANKMLAQAALEGKVNTIIVSPGTNSIVNVK